MNRYSKRYYVVLPLLWLVEGLLVIAQRIHGIHGSWFFGQSREKLSSGRRQIKEQYAMKKGR